MRLRSCRVPFQRTSVPALGADGGIFLLKNGLK